MNRNGCRKLYELIARFFQNSIKILPSQRSAVSDPRLLSGNQRSPIQIPVVTISATTVPASSFNDSLPTQEHSQYMETQQISNSSSQIPCLVTNSVPSQIHISSQNQVSHQMTGQMSQHANQIPLNNPQDYQSINRTNHISLRSSSQVQSHTYLTARTTDSLHSLNRAPQANFQLSSTIPLPIQQSATGSVTPTEQVSSLRLHNISSFPNTSSWLVEAPSSDFHEISSISPLDTNSYSVPSSSNVLRSNVSVTIADSAPSLSNRLTNLLTPSSVQPINSVTVSSHASFPGTTSSSYISPSSVMNQVRTISLQNSRNEMVPSPLSPSTSKILVIPNKSFDYIMKGTADNDPTLRSHTFSASAYSQNNFERGHRDEFGHHRHSFDIGSRPRPYERNNDGRYNSYNVRTREQRNDYDNDYRLDRRVREWR